ncbi:hypothetical protein AAVH_06503 [Aphelenchoides avenae]|nr:hypothetical protein AAVH_06503 [Aphelenchus avenae]
MDFSGELPFASTNDCLYEFDYGFPQVPEWQLYDFSQYANPSSDDQAALYLPDTAAHTACYENYLQPCPAETTSPVSDHFPDFPVPSNSRGRVTEDKEAAQPVTYGPGNDDAKKELSHLNGDSRPTKTSTASCERDQTVGSECTARQKQQKELLAAVRERTTFALVHFICDLLEKPACASICCWTGVLGEFHIKSTRTFTDLWNTRNKSQVSFVKIASAFKGYENTKIQGYTLLKRVNRGHYRFFPDCECSRLPF